MSDETKLGRWREKLDNAYVNGSRDELAAVAGQLLAIAGAAEQRAEEAERSYAILSEDAARAASRRDEWKQRAETAERKWDDATAFCTGEWPCEASTAAAFLERERNDALAERDEARAMVAALQAASIGVLAQYADAIGYAVITPPESRMPMQAAMVRLHEATERAATLAQQHDAAVEALGYAKAAEWYEETFCPRHGVAGDETHARGDCEPCNVAAAIRALATPKEEKP